MPNVTVWDVDKSIPKWIMDIIIYSVNVFATLKRQNRLMDEYWTVI